jgi:Domain of unknown function (DUF4129)
VTLGAGLLALLAVVALAARGHIAGAGGGQTRTVPVDLVEEYALLLFGLAALGLVPVLVVAFARARGETPPRRRRWMIQLLVFMTLIAFGASRLAVRLLDRRQAHGVTPTPAIAKLPVRTTRAAARHDAARFDWVPVIVVLSLALVGLVVGYLLLRRARHSRTSREAQTAEELSAALDESLDDLRREQDARRAVIAAYARLERVLSASGLPRRSAEAPLEYLGRVLRDLLRASASSVSRLTDLFERAKFSQHAIGAELKEEAIEALVAVRDELRGYA